MRSSLTFLSASIMLIISNNSNATANNPPPLKENFNGEQLSQSLAQTMEVYIELQQDDPVAASDPTLKRADTMRIKKDKLHRRLSLLNIKTIKNKQNSRGVNARIHPRDLEKLRALPDVKRVAPVIQHFADHTNSVPWIGAPQAWAILGGNGDNAATPSRPPINVAIIDTGIDYYHQNLGGSGSVAEYQADDPNLVEPGSFPTGKVVSGWDFAGVDAQTPTPDPDPIDHDGHGSHVGGSSAGIGVDARIGEGVAPGANLYAYKVFGDVAASTGLSHFAIMRAADPNQDGNTEDHVDVMNLSLGSPFGIAGAAGANAADEAAAAGAVVVISAGNSGDIPYIVGSPSIAPGAISVASSVAGGETQGADITSDDANANGSVLAIEGAHVNTFADGFSVSGDIIAAQPHDGCGGFTNAADFNGEVALVIRGGCAFSTKYANAQTAGASGIVVYNDGTSPSREAPIRMGGLTPAETISGIMISNDDGENIFNALLNSPATSVVADSSTLVMTDPANDDTLSSFTSRGPGDGNIFKPDLAAPGQSIVSTGVGSGTGPATLSGTSMAAPHAAGVAALLRQKWPDLPSEAIKAMMQNSSTPAYIDGVAGAAMPYPLTLQGVGRVQADVAATLSSYAAPGGISFGRVNPTSHESITKKVTLTNLSSVPRFYRIEHQPNQTMPGVAVSPLLSHVFVPAHGKRSVLLKLVMEPADAPVDSENNSQSEVDGWFVFKEIGGEDLRVGYMAIADPASRVDIYNSRKNKLKFRNRAKTGGFADGFTLAGQGTSPGNSAATIENFGWRSSTLFGAPSVEFALTTKGAWGSLSAYRAILLIDNDEDGIDDHQLYLHDFGALGETTGTVTSQKSPGSTPFSIWTLADADYDYNDSAVFGSWIRDLNAFGPGFPNVGFIPPGDNTFNYQLTIVNRSTGESDSISGSIDLSQEITVDNSSFELNGKKRTKVNVTSDVEGRMLWMYQSNQYDSQSQVVDID